MWFVLGLASKLGNWLSSNRNAPENCPVYKSMSHWKWRLSNLNSSAVFIIKDGTSFYTWKMPELGNALVELGYISVKFVSQGTIYIYI